MAQCQHCEESCDYTERVHGYDVCPRCADQSDLPWWLRG